MNVTDIENQINKIYSANTAILVSCTDEKIAIGTDIEGGCPHTVSIYTNEIDKPQYYFGRHLVTLQKADSSDGEFIDLVLSILS